MRTCILPCLMAALGALGTPQAAAAQAGDARLIPGVRLSEAQILARPGPGRFILKSDGDVRRDDLAPGIRALCDGPARLSRLTQGTDRKPGDITWLVSCS